MVQNSCDMQPNEIKFLISKKGWTYADIDRAYSLPKRTSAKTTKYPHIFGELAIAEVLSLSPREIWPSRYAANGERIKPQPVDNYNYKVSPRQHLKRIRG